MSKVTFDPGKAGVREHRVLGQVLGKVIEQADACRHSEPTGPEQ